jgi:hypothetical protein
MTRPRHHRPTSSGPVGQRLGASTFMGRLVYPTGHGPRSIIVECARANDGYTIHVPAFNDAGNYLVDTSVTLTPVDAPTADLDHVISGHSRLIADHHVDPGTITALERWTDDMNAHYFHITPARPPASSGSRSHRPGRGRHNTSAHQVH